MAARKTREQWLNELTSALRPAFKQAGAPIPLKVRMSCSLTSHARAIGQCWNTSVSADQTFEIMVSPILDEIVADGEQGVAMVLAHELVHASVGLQCGHTGEFKRVSEVLGMTGKVTEQVAGPEFVKLVKPFLKKLGKYPHAKLDVGGIRELPPIMVPNPKDPDGAKIPMPRTSGPKKQGTRLLKASCDTCGYTVRVTRTWLVKAGAPICPCNKKSMVHDSVE